jgi:hypothetical protein
MFSCPFGPLPPCPWLFETSLECRGDIDTLQTLSTPHAYSPPYRSHPLCFLSSCIELCPCCPTIVFSFSKYSFAVPSDVYFESLPNIQLVETSSRQITLRIIFIIITIIIVIIIVRSFQNPAIFHRLQVHFNVSVHKSYHKSYTCMRGELGVDIEQGHGSKRTARAVAVVENNMRGSQ